MTVAPSLFPETAELRLQRLDAEILHLLTGKTGGPLGLALDENCKAVLRHIRFRRGLRNTIRIAEIQQHCGLDERAIKGCVRTLRLNFGLPIGSSKNVGQPGYYLIVDEHDRAVFLKDFLDQVRAQIAVVQAVAGRQSTLELLGQLQLEAAGTGDGADQEGRA